MTTPGEFPESNLTSLNSEGGLYPVHLDVSYDSAGEPIEINTSIGGDEGGVFLTRTVFLEGFAKTELFFVPPGMPESAKQSLGTSPSITEERIVARDAQGNWTENRTPTTEVFRSFTYY